MPRSNHSENILRRDGLKIEKFDTKSKFLSKRTPWVRDSNFRSIEWHQTIYLQVSWKYPFELLMSKKNINKKDFQTVT
jgi:hypothetical protein